MRYLPELVHGDDLCLLAVETDVSPMWIRIMAAAQHGEHSVGMHILLGRQPVEGERYPFAFASCGYPTQQLVAELGALWNIPIEPFVDLEARIIEGLMQPMEPLLEPAALLTSTSWFWFRIEDATGTRSHGSLCADFAHERIWIELEDVEQRRPFLEIIRGVRTQN